MDCNHFENGGETSCGCGNKSLKKENMKTGDFIVKKEYEHSDDRFAIIQELSDVHVVLDVYEYSKNVGTSQAPIDYLQNYRLANDEEIQSYKEMLSEDDEKFNKGGDVDSFFYTWDNLPITFKIDERPTARKNIEFDPLNNDLRLLVQDIVAKDELRPFMSGVFFDENGLVCTDAHKLLYLPYGDKKPKVKGVFNVNDKNGKYTDVKLGAEIKNHKYPKYEGIFPKYEEHIPVDLVELRIYAKALITGFTNRTTKQIRLLINRTPYSFNGEYLIQCIDVLLSLGHLEADLYFESPNRALCFVPKGGQILRDLTVLIMPMFLSSENLDDVDLSNVTIAGGEDIDFSYEFAGIYSVKEKKVLWKNNTYQIDKNITKKDAWDKYELSLTDFTEISKIMKKNKSLAILDYCIVENKKLSCTDLETSITIDDVKLDGDAFYRTTDLGLLRYDNLNNEIEDYPYVVSTLFEYSDEVIEVSDYEYFKETMKYAFKVALKDDLRPNISAIFFETTGNNLNIKSTDAHGFFSNTLNCLSDKNVLFTIPSSTPFSLFNILDNSFVIRIMKSDSDNKSFTIVFKTGKKEIYIRAYQENPKNIVTVLNTYLTEQNTGNYTHKLSISKVELSKIISSLKIQEYSSSKVLIREIGDNYEIVQEGMSFNVNVVKENTKTPKDGMYVLNTCSDSDMTCFTGSSLQKISNYLDKKDIELFFNPKAKVNYLDSLNFEFSKTSKSTSGDIQKPKKEDKNIQETSSEKIQRFKEEIDGYNDLIELAKDDVLEGAEKIASYNEMIDGLELLIELEQDSNPNFEKPIAVMKQVDFEGDKNKFIDYVLGFYGKEGIYADDYKGGFSREQVGKAVEQYLNDPQTDWGMGDSADREIMRDKYLIPLLDDMKNDSGLLTEKEEKEMIEQKLLNKEWDIADNYNRNYMDKYGFYGSDEFLKNFPVIEDVLIKSDEMIGKVFVAEDGANQIVGKKLHPTGNDYEIKRLNTNAIYLISEDAIEQFIKLMEKSTTEEYKQEKRFTDMIDELKKDDKFLNEALGYMLHESPYGVIEEHYFHGADYKNILKRFLEMNNISIPPNKTHYLGHIIDGIKAKYYLRNKQDVVDLLRDKATDGLMNTILGKKYRYTFGKKQLVLNRKQFMDLKLKEGYIVEGEKPKRKLRNPSENSYYSEVDLTRAEFDYAEALYSKKMKEENSLKEVQLKKQEEENRKQEEENRKQEEAKRKQEDAKRKQEQEHKNNIELHKNKIIENSFFKTIQSVPSDKSFKLVFVKINPDLTNDLHIASYYLFGNKYKKINFEAIDLKAVEEGLISKMEGSEEIVSKSDLEKMITDYLENGVVLRFDDLSSKTTEKTPKKKTKTPFNEWMKANNIEVFKRTYYWVADDGGKDPLYTGDTKSEVIRSLKEDWNNSNTSKYEEGGEVSEKEKQEWRKFVLDNSSWFNDESDEDSEEISLTTRRNGNISKEEVGQMDLDEANDIAKKVKSKFPKTQYNIERVDEYVYLYLRPRKTEKELKDEEKIKNIKDKQNNSAKIISEKLNIPNEKALEIIKSFSYSKEYYEKYKNVDADKYNNSFRIYFRKGSPTNINFDNAEQVFNYISEDDFIKSIYSRSNPINEILIGLFGWDSLRLKLNKDDFPYKEDGKTDYYADRTITLSAYPFAMVNIYDSSDFTKKLKKIISDFITAYRIYVLNDYKSEKETPTESKSEINELERLNNEIDGYKDLIELAEIDGNKKDVIRFKEIIEGYELLLEMESENVDSYSVDEKKKDKHFKEELIELLKKNNVDVESLKFSYRNNKKEIWIHAQNKSIQGMVVLKEDFDIFKNNEEETELFIYGYNLPLKKNEENEEVYIDFLNKSKGFTKDRKNFNSYDEAREWGRKNIDNFNSDMIYYKRSKGGYAYEKGGDVEINEKKFYRGGDLGAYNKWKSVDWDSFKFDSKKRSNIYRLLGWYFSRRIDWGKLSNKSKEEYQEWFEEDFLYELNSKNTLEYIFSGRVEMVDKMFDVLMKEESLQEIEDVKEIDKEIDKLLLTDDYEELKTELDTLGIDWKDLERLSTKEILNNIYADKDTKWIIDYFILNDDNWLDFEYVFGSNSVDMLENLYIDLLDSGAVLTEEMEIQQYNLFEEEKQDSEKSNNKINELERLNNEIDGYKDLIELAEIDGNKKDVIKFKEIIEGYELLLEMESENVDSYSVDENKTFETVENDKDFTPAYLMTLDEYKNEVTPIIKEYKKFLRKNQDWFVKPHYSGLVQYSFEEAIELKDSENAVFIDMYGRKMSNEEAVRYNYSYKKTRGFNNKYTQEPTPPNLITENKDFIQKLQKYFSLDELNRLIENDELNSNKRSVRRAIDSDIYKKMLSNNEVTLSKLEEIAKSVGVNLPKKIFDESTQNQMKYESELSAILSKLPSISKDKLQQLISGIKSDLKPLEKVVFEKEYKRYEEIFNNKIGESILADKFRRIIPIYRDIFELEKEYKKEKELLISGREWEVNVAYYKIKGFKKDWDIKLSKWLKEYVDSLKNSIIISIIKNFEKITLPISSFEKLKIKVGYKGFEGSYKINFENGSSFVINFESIGAGGYNIQRYHFRFLTKFSDVKLSDGSDGKTSYYEIVSNFSKK